MSGLGIFGTIITGLDTAIGVFSSIQNAIQNAKDLRSLLEEYEEECRMSKTIVEAVQSKPALHKREVTLVVVKVGTTVTALGQHLKTLDQGRGRFQEISHQLLSGTQERKKLQKLMDRLTRAKDNLTAIITILSSQPAAPNSRRIVRENKSSDRARQFNAPVVKGAAGEDPWKHISEVIVENNEATGQSVQLNVAMTTGNLSLLFKTLAEVEEREVNAELDREAEAEFKAEQMDIDGML